MKEMIKKLQKRSNKKGFTLVEIIVVLVILAILAAIAVPAVLGYVNDAKESKYISEARSIYIVIQTEEAKFKAENGLASSTTAQQLTSTTINGTAASNFYTNTNVKLKDTATSKTGMTVSYINYKDGKYQVKWTSSDTKAEAATIESNKEVKIVTPASITE